MTWRSHSTSPGNLNGLFVLVVEDQPIILLELQALLADHGAQIVGPAADIEESLRLANTAELSSALLDVRLGAQTIAPVARVLEGRGIPFLFYSGQTDTDAVHSEWPDAPFLAKPAPARALVAAIKALSTRRSAAPQP